jgi:hypothetical protein
MKAYKASHNGVCRDFKYEVGETYETDNIEICKCGFHACYKMLNTLRYYEFNKNFVLFEVELLGQIIEDGDKVVTDKIKIVRVVPPEEYVDFKGDDRGNLRYFKDSDGFEYWREFDERNNFIHYKVAAVAENYAYEWRKEYDERNNCIHVKTSTGYEWWKEYDANNNCIRNEYSHGARN